MRNVCNFVDNFLGKALLFSNICVTHTHTHTHTHTFHPVNPPTHFYCQSLYYKNLNLQRYIFFAIIRTMIYLIIIFFFNTENTEDAQSFTEKIQASPQPPPKEGEHLPTAGAVLQCPLHNYTFTSHTQSLIFLI